MFKVDHVLSPALLSTCTSQCGMKWEHQPKVRCTGFEGVYRSTLEGNNGFGCVSLYTTCWFGLFGCIETNT